MLTWPYLISLLVVAITVPFGLCRFTRKSDSSRRWRVLCWIVLIAEWVIAFYVLYFIVILSSSFFL